jgi:hypothetical protein
MKTQKTDLVTLIASFYAEMYGEKFGDIDYTTAMLVLLGNLHDQAFPGYVLDPAQVVEQASAQLRGNRQALQYYHGITFRLPSMTGGDSPLVIGMGVMVAQPRNTLGIWAEDTAINDRIQDVLREVVEEDTIS